ncbi:MAG: GIY-YIG nuclease family protein [Prochlorococcaceae cyanobacterium]
MLSEGIVYVLTNPAMPAMAKIGKTVRGMDARLNELYSTGVPLLASGAGLLAQMI